MSIPASAFVTINPGVVSPGGAALDLNGVILTTNTRVPIGTVLGFPSQLAVSNFFGPASSQAALAGNYFLANQNKTQTPGNLLFSQYVWQNPVPAYLRGLPLTFTLEQLKGGTGAAIVSNAAGVTGATGTIMTVSGLGGGTFAPGQLLTGASVPAGTTIVSQLTGQQGGTGTYLLSTGANVSSAETVTSYVGGSLSLAIDGTTASAAAISLAAATSLSSVEMVFPKPLRKSEITQRR